MNRTNKLVKHLSQVWKQDGGKGVDVGVNVRGWVRSMRKQKRVAFVNLCDGSNSQGVQIVIDNPQTNLPANLSVGSSLSISGGKLVESNRNTLEIQVNDQNSIKVDGTVSSEDKYYPLSKPNLPFTFLRTIPHLRCRTNTFSAIARVRNRMTMSVHEYLQSLDLLQIHAPVITGSDCEGAGEQFNVSCPSDPSFFGTDKSSYLTVSSQLHAEAYASALLPGVYSFGPTFRAENSHTTRHLSEFWMVEPEIGYACLDDIVGVTEGLVRHITQNCMEQCNEDLTVLGKKCEYEFPNRLECLVNSSQNYTRMTYNEAIACLNNSNHVFENTPKWEYGLTTEHEKYLANEYVQGPLFVTDYPKIIKPFYMQESDNDTETVAAMDLLLPHVGEVVGGSVRVHDYEILRQRLDELDGTYDWYLDLRRFGSIPHAGFGLGFDRLVQYMCGLSNIRETIPFPRHPGELLV